jgi:hypothetical protein
MNLERRSMRCGGPKAPGAENVACFRANDCRDGVVCVEGRCTSDIAPIVPQGAGTSAGGSGAMPSVGADPAAADAG